MFLVSSKPVIVMIDSGATYSFVSRSDEILIDYSRSDEILIDYFVQWLFVL